MPADSNKTHNDPTVNEEILDQSLRHALFMQRLASNEAAIIVKFLEELALPRLAAELADVSDQETKARLRQIERTIREILRSSFQKTAGETKRRLGRIVSTEAKAQLTLLETAVPVKVNWNFPSPAQLKAIVNTPVRGRLLDEFWKNLEQTTQDRVVAEFRLAMLEGESVSGMVRRIHGTRRSGYTDGVWRTTKHEVTSFVRTAANHVANKAREELHAANDDIISHVLWVSTLDARTTEICASMDGRTFKVGEGVRPPLHYNCRSIVVPIVKSWKELGLDLADPPPRTRAAKNYTSLENALDGSYPAVTTYGDWLKKQPKEVQDAVLGQDKATLFRRGTVPLQKFSDQKGKPLTLKQLEELENRLKAG